MDTIVNTALALFKKHGYDEVSVRQICKKANVPRSSFYTVFSGKEDILVYSLSRVKGNFEQSMPNFIMAENDLERIWFLSDSFLQQAVSFGPNLCKMYFIMEINGKCELFNILADFNDWLTQLLANCQKNGIARVKGNPDHRRRDSLLLDQRLGLARQQRLPAEPGDALPPLADRGGGALATDHLPRPRDERPDRVSLPAFRGQPRRR